MVSSENRESISEANLQTNQQRHCLHRVISSVHIVAHEQIVCLRRLAANTEEFLQVVELSVDVTADCDGGFHH